MSFKDKNENFKFSQFEFELMMLSCYVRKKRKSPKFSEFEFKFRKVKHDGSENTGQA